VRNSISAKLTHKFSSHTFTPIQSQGNKFGYVCAAEDCWTRNGLSIYLTCTQKQELLDRLLHFSRYKTRATERKFGFVSWLRSASITRRLQHF
jgi:hypothetical protein